MQKVENQSDSVTLYQHKKKIDSIFRCSFAFLYNSFLFNKMMPNKTEFISLLESMPFK